MDVLKSREIYRGKSPFYDAEERVQATKYKDYIMSKKPKSENNRIHKLKMTARRILQFKRQPRPFLHDGKYNGADLRKIRSEKGVGGPSNG